MNHDQKEPARIRIVRFVFGLLAVVYILCIVLQVFFAGLGVLVDSKNLQLHRTFANTFEFLPILMFLLSWAGRIRGTLRWFNLVLVALTSLQHATIIAFAGSLRAIHTVDAILLFWISLHMVKRSWPWVMFKTDPSVSKATGV